MRWTKRLAAGVLAAGMALTLLTACGGGGGASISNGVVVEPAGDMTEMTNVQGSTTYKLFSSTANRYRQAQLLKVKDVSNGEEDLLAENVNNCIQYVGTEKTGYLLKYYEPKSKIDHEKKTSESASSVPVRLMMLVNIYYKPGAIRKVESGRMKVNGAEYYAEVCTGDDTSFPLEATYTFFYQEQEASRPAYIIIENIRNEGNKKIVFEVESYEHTTSDPDSDDEVWQKVNKLQTY